MKAGSATVLVLGLLLAGPATAQSYGGNRYSTDDYDYARVIRVDPIIESERGARRISTSQRCYTRDADETYVYDDRGGYYGNDPYRNDGYRDDRYRDGYYGDDYYGDGDRGSDGGRTIAAVIGGLAGAVLGSQIGDGGGRYVGTAVGSMVGGMAGRSIYDSTQRQRRVQHGTVRVCDPVPVGYGGYDDGRVAGYDVTYEYAGRTYHTRTDHHPGDRIRVRMDVRPD